MVLPVGLAARGEERLIAAVVVTWSSAREVGDCLRSLAAHGVDEIVVVDNASPDATREVVRREAPSAKLICNSENRGFAAAVNQGVRAASQPLLLVLNPDAELLTPLDAENEMVREAARADAGVVGGRLVDGSGRPQAGFNVRAFPTPGALAAEALLLNRFWPSNPINRRYRCLDFDPERAQDIDQPAGAFLLFRREVFDAVDGFDESFRPLWFEDVDFCLRVSKAGYRNRYSPAATAKHAGAHSLRDLAIESREAAWYGNLLRFASKHFSANAHRRLQMCVRAGRAVRRWARAAGFGADDFGRRSRLAGDGSGALETAKAVQGFSATTTPKS